MQEKRTYEECMLKATVTLYTYIRAAQVRKRDQVGPRGYEATSAGTLTCCCSEGSLAQRFWPVSSTVVCREGRGAGGTWGEPAGKTWWMHFGVTQQCEGTD